jgi:hypothetical protein
MPLEASRALGSALTQAVGGTTAHACNDDMRQDSSHSPIQLATDGRIQVSANPVLLHPFCLREASAV